MKKILLAAALIAFGTMEAQTPSKPISGINNIQITGIVQGHKSDSVMVIGTDKVIKFLPASVLIGPIPVPNLEQVLTKGNTTIKNIFFNGGSGIFSSNGSLTTYTNNDGIRNNISVNDGTFQSITRFATDRLEFSSSDPASKGIRGSTYFGNNLDSLSYTQEKYVVPITGTRNNNPITGPLLLKFDDYENFITSNYIEMQNVDHQKAMKISDESLYFGNNSTGEDLTIGNETGIVKNLNEILVATNGVIGSGFTYADNYFANTTDRSILDKEGVLKVSVPIEGTRVNNPITGVIKTTSTLDIIDTENNLLGSFGNDGGGDGFLNIGQSLLSSTGLVTVGLNLKKANDSPFSVGINATNITGSYILNLPNKTPSSTQTLSTIEDLPPVGVEGSIPVWQAGVLSTIPSELSYDTTNKRFSFGTQAALNPDANSNFKYKIGNGPTTGFDFYSTFRVSESRSTVNNFNGIESNIYTTLSGNSTARARAGKFVSNIILNGYNSTNAGGGGEGLEAVTRVTGNGVLDVAVGAYTRILIDDNNATVNNAVNFIAPTNSATAAHPFPYSAGMVLSEQAATNTINAANLVVGTPMADVGSMSTNLRWTGNYSIWNEGVNKNYFKSFLGINNIAPTEMLDVVGNIKATGNVNAGGLTIPTAALSITGGSSSNFIFGDGSLGTRANTIQNQVLTSYVTGNNTPVTATNTVRTAIQDLQAQITALTPLTATATLDFPSAATGTSADLTINVTNAVVGKPVYLGYAVAAVNANTSYTAFVSAAGVVTVRLNNYSTAAVNPASATFTVNVTK